MRCEQIRDLLSPYMDQMTNEKETQLVEAHLLQCSECQKELGQLRLLASVLNNLESPQVPETFSQDLHRRLLEEQNKIFAFREARRPKKPGWIAAGIAGLALTVGVYASSVLPIGTMVASWQDKANEEKKPEVAVVDKSTIDKIIEATRIAVTDEGQENPERNVPPDNPEPLPNNSISEPEVKIKQPGGQPNNNVPQAEEPREVTPRIADEYSTKIKVDNLNESLGEVIKLAQANEAEYAVLTGSKTLQALSAVTAKEIDLTVDKDKAEKLLEELGSLGQASSPLHDKKELTEKYNEAENKVQSITEQITAIKAQENVSAEDEAELAELNKELAEWQAKKARLDKQLNKVILKVYLVEEGQH